MRRVVGSIPDPRRRHAGARRPAALRSAPPEGRRDRPRPSPDAARTPVPLAPGREVHARSARHRPRHRLLLAAARGDRDGGHQAVGRGDATVPGQVRCVVLLSGAAFDVPPRTRRAIAVAMAWAAVT